MPRSTRVITEAGLYHVVARGNNRQELFHEPEDYEIYLRFILKMKSHYDFHLYHYCLMPNHVHLLLRFYEAEPFRKFPRRRRLLSFGMRTINWAQSGEGKDRPACS